MNNRFVLVMMACVVAFGGLFWFNKYRSSSDNSGKSSASQPSNHQFGDGKKAVTLIEYGDYQCPACFSYESTIKQVRDKYKDTINLQFRNFPLTQIHQNAMAGHRAVEAASLQGKFWEMHDLIFERSHQFNSEGKVSETEWTAASNPQPFFERYAEQLNLDVNKFKEDMKSEKVNGVINADLKAGRAVGADSTPTFVLQGKKINENPRDLAGFSRLIDDAIASAKK